MMLHYIKLAFRNMRRQTLYAAINIGGFAIGIAACMLIALYIRRELNYDINNPNRNRIVRVIGIAKQNGITHSGISFPAPMAKALANDFPQVEKAGRIMPNKLFGGANNHIRRPDQQYDTYEEGFSFADSTMLDILNVQMIYGDRERALAEPNSVVLCKSMADKFFPNQNPVGQVLIFNDNAKDLIRVGGVMEDFPPNAHLQFRGFISLSGINFWSGEQETWTSSNYGIYLLLKKGTDVASLQKQMTEDVINKYFLPALKAQKVHDAEASVKDATLYLQPLPDIHLKSYNIEEDVVRHGDIRYIWMFAAIALFILLLACINFLNLSTARSANRAKEVGVRKVIGSFRKDLVKQFLVESMVYSFLSFIVAIVIAYAALPFFNKITNELLLIPWNEWWLIPVLILSAVVVGIIAGLYPAFYLSWFNPVNVLKGKLSLGSRNGRLRSTLVVFQFTISVILLIGTMVIYRQMNYILHSSLGYDKDQVVMIQGTNALRSQTASFKNELLQLPFVKNASVGDFLPVTGTKRNGNGFWKEGRVNEESAVTGQRWVVDDRYVPTYGMKLIAGRNFSPERSTDSQCVIINQAMADKIGLDEPVGKIITNGYEHWRIIGVVENFNFESMKQQIDPVCMVLGNSNTIVSVKIDAANTSDAIASINAVWKKFSPHQTLRYAFVDERFAAMYADVQRTSLLFSCFFVLTIIVACLGLFALAAFMVEQRSKEITIRKVLGATIIGLFALLTKNFMKLILVSLLIAAPVGWYLMNLWLRDYAYRINITWDVFALTAVSVTLIALATICYQALKVAFTQPATRLRNE